MGFEPVGGGGVGGGEADVAVVGVFHFLHHYLLHLLQFGGQHVEVQFIVHLQNHLRFDAFLLKAAVDGNHRNLHHIGGGALDWGVHGVAFAELAHHCVA